MKLIDSLGYLLAIERNQIFIDFILNWNTIG